MNDEKIFNKRSERRDAAENRQRILDAALMRCVHYLFRNNKSKKALG